MVTLSVRKKYRAVAMEMAAYLDDHYTEMRVLTDTGDTLAIICNKASIIAVQQHIEQMARACPEILTWDAERA